MLTFQVFTFFVSDRKSLQTRATKMGIRKGKNLAFAKKNKAASPKKVVSVDKLTEVASPSDSSKEPSLSVDRVDRSCLLQPGSTVPETIFSALNEELSESSVGLEASPSEEQIGEMATIPSTSNETSLPGEHINGKDVSQKRKADEPAEDLEQDFKRFQLIIGDYLVDPSGALIPLNDAEKAVNELPQALERETVSTKMVAAVKENPRSPSINDPDYQPDYYPMSTQIFKMTTLIPTSMK